MLAEHADVHRNYIGQIERGEQNITIDSLAWLVKALRCKDMRAPNTVRKVKRVLEQGSLNAPTRSTLTGAWHWAYSSRRSHLHRLVPKRLHV